MKQEDKELLLRDLCARLPHKVIVEFISYKGEEKPWIGELSCKDLDSFIHDVEYIEIKPYLRPLSSMSEEQKEEFYKFFEEGITESANETRQWLRTKRADETIRPITIAYVMVHELVIDWLNKYHFDYRGLIEKGLALEAPKEMYN